MDRVSKQNEEIIQEHLPDFRSSFGDCANLKLLALTCFAETDSIEAASRASGQPPPVVRKWVNDPDNAETIREIREAVRMGMANRYLQILHVSTNKLMERMEHGDPHVLRDGTVIYKEISARDLAAIADIASKNHAVLTGNIAPESMNSQRLQALAQLISQEIPRRVKATTGKPKLPKQQPEDDVEDGLE